MQEQYFFIKLIYINFVVLDKMGVGGNHVLTVEGGKYSRVAMSCYRCRVTDSVLGWKPYDTEFYDVHVLLALSDGHLINVFWPKDIFTIVLYCNVQ